MLLIAAFKSLSLRISKLFSCWAGVDTPAVSTFSGGGDCSGPASASGIGVLSEGSVSSHTGISPISGCPGTSAACAGISPHNRQTIRNTDTRRFHMVFSPRFVNTLSLRSVHRPSKAASVETVRLTIHNPCVQIRKTGVASQWSLRMSPDQNYIRVGHIRPSDSLYSPPRVQNQSPASSFGGGHPSSCRQSLLFQAGITIKPKNMTSFQLWSFYHIGRKISTSI